MDNDPPKNPGQKTLHVWSKPVDPKDGAQVSQDASGAPPPGGSRIKDAVAMIKKEDFLNVASTPCARQGFLAGIASGVGMGALKFIVQGNPGKSANWAVATFVLGSTISYEYCQYKRRAERAQMKRNIEVVAHGRREQARKAAEAAEATRKTAEESRRTAETAAEERKEQLRLEQERTNAAQKPWYKVW